MSFLPTGYEVPKSQEQRMKLEKGKNKFRILASPTMGYVGWKDKKPTRFHMEEDFDPNQFEKLPKHFWAMPVWNYAAESVQYLELTQKSILKSIINLSENPDWGSPLKYDITIERVGDSLETEYILTPSPSKDMPPEIQMTIKDALAVIEMDRIFENKSPFNDDGVATPESKVKGSTGRFATSDEEVSDEDLPF